MDILTGVVLLRRPRLSLEAILQLRLCLNLREKAVGAYGWCRWSRIELVFLNQLALLQQQYMDQQV